MSQVSKFGISVVSELSQSRKVKCSAVESELNHLDCHMSQSSQPEKYESDTTLALRLIGVLERYVHTYQHSSCGTDAVNVVCDVNVNVTCEAPRRNKQ